jgi:ketosteroid isomerase-like protein
MIKTREGTDTTTREALEAYFDSLRRRQDWPSLLAEDMTFTSFTSPIKRLNGRAAFLESTRRFYSIITDIELRQLIVEGERACALTHYHLKPPNGQTFESDVAEVFTVRGGKIASFDIYFDTAPYPK